MKDLIQSRRKSLFNKISLQIVKFLNLLIKLYSNLISPLFPGSCRFRPTCSSYVNQAMMTWGLCHGIWLGIKRLSKCHPWGPSGYDPVPIPRKEKCNGRRVQGQINE